MMDNEKIINEFNVEISQILDAQNEISSFDSTDPIVYLEKDDVGIESSIPPTTDANLDKISFINYHQPALKEGDYEVEAWQKVRQNNTTETTHKILQKFRVTGPRYTLPPEDINAVFPPKNSTGNHSNVLPHIAFNRVSLPWEIEMKGQKPWFCLVLFSENEVPEIQEKKLSELKLDVPEYFNPEKMVHTIECPNKFIPSKTELLTHIRKRLQHNTTTKEMSYVVAHRLPAKNTRTTIHLISLKDSLPDNRYISLYHWEFECLNNRPIFKEILKDVIAKPLRLTPTKNDNRYYQKGFVPLPHFLRLGTQTVSLYRSPLLPYQYEKRARRLLKSGATKKKKPRYAYERVEWKKGIDMGDVSYATAFQIGLTLTIAKKNTAIELYNWKRSIYQQKKRYALTKEQEGALKTMAELSEDFEYTDYSDKPTLPQEITHWISELMRLVPIPFNYLVPYEAMLPNNSIRYFLLDKLWLKNCLEGVFSVGEEYFHFDANHPLFQGDYTGFLLRNEVVADYPEMQIKAYTDIDCIQESEVFFKRKLGKDILFCCFKNKIATLDLFLPTEAIHFGFEEILDNQYQKSIRKNKGEEVGTPIIMDDLINSDRYINLTKLCKTLKVNSSSELAYQMVEGSPKVRFFL
jgi:hypothetical protein